MVDVLFGHKIEKQVKNENFASERPRILIIQDEDNIFLHNCPWSLLEHGKHTKETPFWPTNFDLGLNIHFIVLIPKF